MKTIIFFFCIFFLVSTGYAQEREEEKDTLKYEIEELTITGTRTLKKIIDIPYSVFRVDKEELIYGKKVSAKDLLADVPGLFLQNRYGNSDLRISLRGYGTRSNSGIRGIRILQDNIPVSEADGQTVVDEIDFNALGGVEVVKGNISSLYANAPGGVINFLTDLYYPQSFIKTSNQYGKFGLKQTDERFGIKADKYRFTMSYNYRNVDGYRPHSNEYSNLVNGVFEGYIGEKATLTVLGNYVRSQLWMPGALTEEEYDTDPLQASKQAESQDLKRFTKKGRLAVRFKTFLGKNENNEFEATGFGTVKNLESNDYTSVTILNRYSAGSFLRFRNKSKILKRDNDFNIGFDYAFQSGPVTTYQNIGGHKDITIDNEIEDNVGNYGIYFYNQYSILKNKMDLYVSGRFDKFIYTRNEQLYNGYIDTERVFQQFTPKVALNYKLTPSIALYTSYGLGYDIPSADELGNYSLTSNGGRTTLNPDLNPQKSNNFEFGIKGNLINKKRTEWFRKIFFDATFFNYVIRDEIVPFIVGGISYYRNAARTNRMGVEFGFKSEPFEGVELTTNYIYTNFKYKQYDALISDLNGTITHQDYSNNVMPSYPGHILNFILSYEYELSEKINGLLQFDCDYVTKMYADDKNSVTTSPYFTSNPMAGINILLGKFNFLAFVGANNIFDKRYVGFIDINDYYGRFFETGEPRNIYGGLNISYKF
ncbi:MAG: TonB-dependent receptor [Ignavibacteria bacterium]|jgi:iron complex outermembrane receptor protein